MEWFHRQSRFNNWLSVISKNRAIDVQDVSAGAERDDEPSIRQSGNKSAEGSKLPLYEYTPVDQGEIRLVVLLPGRYNDRVRVQIEHWRLDQKPAYAAISYFWGGSTNRRPVFVGSRVLLVTYNLWQALRRVRDVEQETMLWTDAICINQSDDKEKSLQLAYMPIIYPEANRVLCWLGDDDGTVALAFKTLTKWAKANGDGKDSQEKERARIRLAQSVETQLAIGTKDQRALTALFERPWWRRVWTLQEICVDVKKQPLLLCGQHEIGWLSLYFACITMFTTATVRQRDFAFGPNIVHVLPMLRVSWIDQKYMLLSNLIRVAVKREASDRRDKIFALLGLMTQAGRHYPEADYSMTVRQVCMEYTRAIIRLEQSLAILQTSEIGIQSDNLPSWAVKLDCRGPHHSGARKEFEHDELLRSQLEMEAIVGTCPVTSEPAFRDDPILVLHGITVDTVHRIHQVSGLAEYFASKARTWTDIIVQAEIFEGKLRLPDSAAKSKANLTEAILRTLTTNKFYSTSQRRHEQRVPSLYTSYRRFLFARNRVRTLVPEMNADAMLDYIQTNFRFRIGSEDVRTMHRNEVAGSDQTVDPVAEWFDRRLTKDLLSEIDTECSDRVLIVTHKGYMGLAPKTCREGYRVCLLAGALMPIVLRPLPTRIGEVYQLVGEAYVDGLVTGKLMAKDRADSRVTQRYPLI